MGQYVLERPGFNVFAQGKATSDNHFIFAGISDEFDTLGDFYLVKTDTNANELWEKVFGTDRYEYGLSVDVASDGGYYIFGSSDGYGNSLGFRSQGLLIKTDSAGNEQWRESWGGAMTNATGMWRLRPMGVL